MKVFYEKVAFTSKIYNKIRNQSHLNAKKWIDFHFEEKIVPRTILTYNKYLVAKKEFDIRSLSEFRAFSLLLLK